MKDTDTCYQCLGEYDPDNEGHTHDENCACCFCDADHYEYDAEGGQAIRDHVREYGFLDVCSSECEDEFRRTA